MGAETDKVHRFFFLVYIFFRTFSLSSFPSSARDELRSSDMPGKVRYHTATFPDLENGFLLKDDLHYRVQILLSNLSVKRVLGTGEVVQQLRAYTCRG